MSGIVLPKALEGNKEESVKFLLRRFFMVRTFAATSEEGLRAYEEVYRMIDKVYRGCDGVS